MTKIAIAKDSVSTIANEFNNEAITLNDMVKLLDEEVNAIDNAWSGADAVNYLKNMRDNFKSAMTAFSEAMNDHSAFLTKVPAEYENVDEEFRNRVIEV